MDESTSTSSVPFSIIGGNRMYSMPQSVFNRARNGKSRRKKLRNPIEKMIDGHLFVFTKREFGKVKVIELPDNTPCKSWHQYIRKEIKEKIMMSKRLSVQRTYRLRNEANAAGIQRESKNN